jgi:bacillithiol biosynthesis deacetylase BshB1
MTDAVDPLAVDLLAFGAHPDDVELCCGGLLATAAAQGYRTAVVDLSRGELASAGTPELRAREAARAAEILGVSLRENLHLPDGWLNPWAGYEAPDRAIASAMGRVVAVLRRLRPSLVLIPWSHERHPDHEAAAALLGKALFFSGVAGFVSEPALPPFVPVEVLRYPMRYELEPSFIVDVSEVAARKLEAIAAYASQLDPPGRTTLIGSPLTLDAFQARDRYYGAMIGAAAGEPYALRGPMGLRDPIRHFRENPGAGRLFFGRPR